MRFEAHCALCQQLLGDPCEEVNLWIDELAWVDRGACAPKQFNPKHRRYRHHREGIEEARARWGELGAKAATLHVMADLGLKDPNDIPRDEADFVLRGR